VSAVERRAALANPAAGGVDKDAFHVAFVAYWTASYVKFGGDGMCKAFVIASRSVMDIRHAGLPFTERRLCRILCMMPVVIGRTGLLWGCQDFPFGVA